MYGPPITPKQLFEVENLLSTYLRFVHAGIQPSTLRKAMSQPSRSIAPRKALKQPTRPTKSIADLGRELETMAATQRQAQANARQAQRETLQKAIADINGRIQASIGRVPARVIVDLDLQLRSISERASRL